MTSLWPLHFDHQGRPAQPQDLHNSSCGPDALVGDWTPREALPISCPSPEGPPVDLPPPRPLLGEGGCWRTCKRRSAEAGGLTAAQFPSPRAALPPRSLPSGHQPCPLVFYAPRPSLERTTPYVQVTVSPPRCLPTLPSTPAPLHHPEPSCPYRWASAWGGRGPHGQQYDVWMHRLGRISDPWPEPHKTLFSMRRFGASWPSPGPH